MNSKYELWMLDYFGWRCVDWGDDLSKLQQDARVYESKLNKKCKVFAVERFEQKH